VAYLDELKEVPGSFHAPLARLVRPGIFKP
jgi:hypothetical protein